MTVCPDCGYENLEGVDVCEQCGQSLSELSAPRPSSPIEQGLLADRIASLAPKEPLTVSPETPVRDVLTKMSQASIGCVMVVDDDGLRGIFSERDALLKLSTDVRQLDNEPIASMMTPDPEVLETKDKIAFALHKMDLGGYRHLPILSGGKLVGVISIRDILHYLTERISEAQPQG